MQLRHSDADGLLLIMVHAGLLSASCRATAVGTRGSSMPSPASLGRTSRRSRMQCTMRHILVYRGVAAVTEHQLSLKCRGQPLSVRRIDK
jgi:hypothetical protein